MQILMKTKYSCEFKVCVFIYENKDNVPKQPQLTQMFEIQMVK